MIHDIDLMRYLWWHGTPDDMELLMTWNSWWHVLANLGSTDPILIRFRQIGKLFLPKVTHFVHFENFFKNFLTFFRKCFISFWEFLEISKISKISEIFLIFLQKKFLQKKILKTWQKSGPKLNKKYRPLIFFTDLSTPQTKDILVIFPKIAIFQKKNVKSQSSAKSAYVGFIT